MPDEPATQPTNPASDLKGATSDHKAPVTDTVPHKQGTDPGAGKKKRRRRRKKSSGGGQLAQNQSPTSVPSPQAKAQSPEQTLSDSTNPPQPQDLASDPSSPAPASTAAGSASRIAPQPQDQVPDASLPASASDSDNPQQASDSLQQSTSPEGSLRGDEESSRRGNLAPELDQIQASAATSDQPAGESVPEPHIVPAESVMVDVPSDPAPAAVETDTTQDRATEPSQTGEIDPSPESPETSDDLNKPNQTDTSPEVDSEPHIVPAESVMVDVPPDSIGPSADSEMMSDTSVPTEDLAPIADPGTDTSPIEDSPLPTNNNTSANLESPEASPKPIKPPARSRLPLILIIVFGVAALGGGWYVMSSFTGTASLEEVIEPTSAPEPTIIPTPAAKQYQTEHHGVTFSYPPNYTVSGSLAPDLESWTAGQGITVTDVSHQLSPYVAIKVDWDGYGPSFYNGQLDVDADGEQLVFTVKRSSQEELTDIPEGAIPEGKTIFSSDIVTINNIPFRFELSYEATDNQVIQDELLSILSSIQINPSASDTDTATSSGELAE